MWGKVLGGGGHLKSVFFCCCCLFVFQGGQLIRAPSMTLSESQAMDTFEFLGSEDNILAHRFSKTSLDLEGKRERERERG